MKRHHRALAEADQRQRRGRKISAFELGIEEAFKKRPCLIHSGPALLRISKRQRKPFAAGRRLPAGTRCMWRHESGLRQQLLPGSSDLDQVIAVGTVAVQKHDQLACGTRAGLEPRAVKFSHSSFSFSSPSCWPSVWVGRSAEPAPRLVSLPHDNKPRANAPPRHATGATLRPFL